MEVLFLRLILKTILNNSSIVLISKTDTEQHNNTTEKRVVVSSSMQQQHLPPFSALSLPLFHLLIIPIHNHFCIILA
jgi:hypothetical protein